MRSFLFIPYSISCGIDTSFTISQNNFFTFLIFLGGSNIFLWKLKVRFRYIQLKLFSQFIIDNNDPTRFSSLSITLSTGVRLTYCSKEYFFVVVFLTLFNFYQCIR